MPELPEVECWGRRVAEKHCLGRTIRSVYAQADERIVIDGVTPQKLASALKGRTIEACHRRGKQMWWTLSGGGPSPLWHFGMTGAFCHYEKLADRPRFLKVELLLDDDTRFGFVDPRRFGRIRLIGDPLNEPPLSGLGPDAWLDPQPMPWWTQQLARRKTPIKALLLNQSFLAGIGNWIVDEVCYQSHIAPQRIAKELSQDEIKRLRAKLKHILQKACDWEADYTHFPKTWLFHHRWGRNQEALTGRGEEIAFDTVGGRTTAWVPNVQQ